ncbi:MAG: hypothetical protein GW938_15090 [Leptospira sp.]|nr:hypothetical protein [Leptospira sp.]NCS94784.1 hypothetical protein [Leptospira sp.]
MFNKLFSDYTSEIEKKLYILFEELNEEEKIKGLDQQAMKEVNSFLMQLADGLSIPIDEYESLKNELSTSFDKVIEVGGKDKVFAFAQLALEDDKAKEFQFSKERIRYAEEDKSFNFLSTYPIKVIYSFLKDEDEQIISVVLNTLKFNEATEGIHEKLTSLFPNNLPPVMRNVKKGVLREIERVIERRLSSFMSE